MRTYVKLVLGAVSAFMLASAAFAADVTPVEENWAVSLGGVGNTITTDGGDSAFGVDLSVGRTGKLLLPIEAGLRQSVSYNGDDTLLTTKVYSDWTLFTIKSKLDVKMLDFFAGGNVGLTYGNTEPQWEIAPEAGVRWWVRDNVAVLGRVEYPFDLEGWESKDNLRYFLGFQVKF